MISVLILTKDEEKDLPRCIEAVPWSDDIHVLDSFSTDATVSIAESRCATVTRRVFDNWSAQQNWGLRHIPFKYPWVFYLVVEPIRVEAYAWVCARATVQMGVTVGEGGGGALGAVATRDISPWTVCASVSARPIKTRDRERFMSGKSTTR